MSTNIMSNNIVEKNDDTQQQQQNNMMILYYCYPPSPIPQTQLDTHTNFHKTTCTNLNLGGRIRVSEEGINGVLSGTETNLRKYESELRLELIKLVGGDTTTSIDIHDGEDINGDANIDKSIIQTEVDPTTEWLDMKYCHLRKEIPTSQQLFNTLSVKITREVVSLIEPPKQVGKKSSRGRARCKQRRKQKRREKERLEKLLQEECIVQVINDGEDKVVNGDHEVANDTSIQQQTKSSQDMHQSKPSDSVSVSTPPLTNHQEVGTAISIKDWEKTTPAVHLSPQQWNEKLLQLSQEKNINDEQADKPDNESSEEHDDTRQQQKQQQNQTIPKDAILLDTRNMYETKIGHFAIPNLETFFPNTRKFSSLPQALNTKEAAEALAGKEVYMYCTGGVRCERAGSYLRALSESNSGAWQGKEQPKGIYQLQGGIQKYLESYGREEQELIAKQDVNEEEEDTTDIQTAEKKCLYRGKNFVFDPRRTDPIIGNGITGCKSEAAGSSIDTKCIVGKCIICSCPHDDYDNGHAPCEEKEARCCRCRVLVLVCNDCRKKVYSWGEEGSKINGGDGGEGEIVKTDLFCGKGGAECIDEGNVADQVETSQF